jgi:hypothetical protein
VDGPALELPSPVQSGGVSPGARTAMNVTRRTTSLLSQHVQHQHLQLRRLAPPWKQAIVHRAGHN